MYERKRDEELGIKTVGLREWGRREERYNRYEATPYRALDRLFNQYQLSSHHKVIDFGAGRGRVSFYLHHKFNVPVIGVEVNEKTLDEALWNLDCYLAQENVNDAPIRFDYGMAEHYDVDDTANCFYFFNPFSLEIYIQVFKNIEASYRRNPRAMEMIIYYPLPEVDRYISQKTAFRRVEEYFAYGPHGPHGRFYLYRREEV